MGKYFAKKIFIIAYHLKFKNRLNRLNYFLKGENLCTENETKS